jgi:hypothetical protein
MRLWVRSGAMREAVVQIFEGAPGRSGRRNQCGALPASRALSPSESIPGRGRRQKEKTTLSGARARVSGVLRVAAVRRVPVREC